VRLLELRRLDGRALDHVAGLFLSEAQDVIRATADPGVVDLPAIMLAGRLKLSLQRVELLLKRGHVAARLNDVRFERSNVVVDCRAVISAQCCGKVSDRARGIVEQAKPCVVRCIHELSSSGLAPDCLILTVSR
jgi:hypothetical protein